MNIRPLLLSLALCAAYLSGSITVAQETPEADDDFIDELLQSLSPEEKVGQLFLVGFKGAVASDEVRQFIAEHKVGGVYLNRPSCNIINGPAHDPVRCNFPNQGAVNTPDQIARLTQELQQASCQATDFCLPLFVAVDHEGDDRPLARLLNGFTPIPSNMAIGATFDPEQAESVGCIVGRELAGVGINMLFGPDLDILDPPTSGGAGDQSIRVFGGDPRWAGEMGVAYVDGVHECGGGRVATVAKHLPGHGRSTRAVDTEVQSLVTKTLEELEQVDLVPFGAVSQGRPAGPGVTDSIMTSHLSYTEVANCDDKTPVTFSRDCMQAFLGLQQFAAWREADGLIVVDDLGVGAVQAYAGRKFGGYLQPDVVAEALIAGNDLLLLIQPRQYDNLGPTIAQLAGGYRQNAQVRERVDDAVRRILTLKYRQYPGLDPSVITSLPDFQGSVGQTDSAMRVESLAAKSLTFIKPDGPEEFRTEISAPSAGERILFVECWADPTCSAPNPNDKDAYPVTWPRGKLEALTTELFPGRVSDMDTIGFSDLGGLLDGNGDDSVRTLVEEADWLVFAFLERDQSGFPDSEVLKQFLKGPTVFDLGDKKVVVFAYNSPYHLDAGELSNVDLFIALYSKTEPSLRASLNALFQETSFFLDAGGGGRLPVDYVYEQYVLYDLSEQVKPEPAQTVQLVTDPEQPTAGQEFTVALAQPLLARNGHRVPNGTKLDFTFELADGSLKEVSAPTTDGKATATITSPTASDVQVTIVSEGVELLTSQPIAVQGGAAGAGDGDGGGGGFPVLLVVSVAGAVPLASVGLGMALYLGRRRWLLTKSRTSSDQGQAAMEERAGSLSGRGPLPSPGEIDRTRASGTSETRTFADGRYVARQVLGEGGQKSVFLVHDTALERDCALSLIKTDLVDPDDLTRVRREAQAMAQLGAQPHIVTVFDIGDEDGRPYIVCEYVSGGDLRQELYHAGGSLPLHRAVAIAMDVCRALAVVHRRGIVHRDIKPANIWLTEDGSAKLGDFGVALAADRSRLTMAGTVTGTAAYMAPEQALGAEVDARSDLYSLGCVLYEMACGRPPFAGDDPLAVISQHVNVAPSPPSQHNQDIPQELEGLILKLLAKGKEERPSSAEEALAELERLATELA